MRRIQNGKDWEEFAVSAYDLGTKKGRQNGILKVISELSIPTW